MSDGSPYPNGVRSSVIRRRYDSSTRVVWVHLQLTSCRLAAKIVTLKSGVSTVDLIAWDWKTGEVCMVSYTRCPAGKE
jgi:hypothetical protein